MTTDQEMLKEAARILREAQMAIGQIIVERDRGMGYFHAEVDWLVDELENINSLIKAIKARGEK
jgi:trans-aconitate methyltransferase